MASARDAFFQRIFELIESGEDIVVITPDLGAPSLDELREKYPERYISVGIAEQNLISVASGLALAGKKVVAYGLGPFPVTRGYDQIRSLLAEFNIPVTLCALNAGFCSAEAGYTHMPVEDFGMMRMLANVRMYNPSDETISKKLAEETVTASGPRYIRFDKAVRGIIYNKEEIDTVAGYTVYGDTAPETMGIVTFGCYISEIRSLVERFWQDGKKIKLIDVFGITVDAAPLLSELKKCKSIITIEENVIQGGLGAYVLELLADNNMSIPVKRMGYRVENGYYHVYTNREYIRENQKLDLKSIEQVITKMLEEG